MNISIKDFRILFIAILLYGCKEHNSNCVLIEFSTNRDIVIRKQIDTCSNVILEDQEFNKDTSNGMVANGYSKKFYPNGQLKNLSFYKNGIQDSASFSYYENGLRSRSNYFLGDTNKHFFGPQYYYSLNNYVDSIEDYSQYGEKWLTLRFDKNKNVKSVSGGLMHITLSEKNPYFDSIPIKFPLFLIIQSPKVEGMNTELKIKIEQKNVILLDTVITEYITFFNSSMTGLKHSFNKKGDYAFYAKITLKDSINSKERYSEPYTKKITVY